MDDWNQDHHSRSGLLDEVKNSEISQEDAEMRTLNFIKEHVGKNKSPLCGNTIHHDRKFLTLVYASTRRVLSLQKYRR